MLRNSSTVYSRGSLGIAGTLTYTSNIAPTITAIVPAIRGALKTSSFRLNRKEKVSTKTGDIAKIGATLLAGAILRAVYLSSWEALTNRPLKMNRPIVPIFILLMATLRSRFTKDKPKMTLAAV